MKLHLKTQTSILLSRPQLPLIHCDGKIIYYKSPYVYFVDEKCGTVINTLKYENVNALVVAMNKLYVCTHEIYVHTINDIDCVEVITLSKVLIRRIAVWHDTDGIENILVCKVNMKMHKLRNRQIVKTLESKEQVEGVFLNESMYGYYGRDWCVGYNEHGLALDMEMDDLVGAYAVGQKIYTASFDGRVREWGNGDVRSYGMDITSAEFRDNVLYCGGGQVVHRIVDGEVESVDVLELISDYSCAVQHNECIKIKRVENELNYSEECGEDNDNSEEDNVNSEEDNVNSVADNDNSEEDNVNSEADNENNEEDNVNSEEYNENSNDSIKSKSHRNKIFNISSSSEKITKDSGIKKNGNNIHKVRHSDLNNKRVKKNGGNELLEVEYVDDSFIVIGNIVLLHDQFQVEKIYCFADDVVEMVTFGEYVLCGNSVGCIVYTKYDRYKNDESFFEGHVVVIHEEAITGLSISGNYLLSGSRDGTAKLSRMTVDGDGRLQFVVECVFNWAGDMDYVSAVGYKNGIIAIARSNCMLELYKALGSEESGCTDRDNGSYDDNIENEKKDEIICCELISMQKSHAKQINHVLVLKEYVITSSADRTAKIYTHEGKIVKTVTMDRVIHSVGDQSYIAVFSHKAVKVFDTRLVELVTFQLKKPVLSACFHLGYLLCASDVLRVYDIFVKKCVKAYDCNLSGAWSFNYPLICGENKIVILEDESEKIRDQLRQELRVLREESFFVEKHTREGNYDAALAILANSTDYRKIYNLMSKAYEKDKSLGFLSYFAATKNKIYDAILKVPHFKHAELFSAIVAQEATKTSDRNIKTKILKITVKHFKGLTELLCDLKGMQ